MQYRTGARGISSNTEQIFTHNNKQIDREMNNYWNRRGNKYIQKKNINKFRNRIITNIETGDEQISGQEMNKSKDRR